MIRIYFFLFFLSLFSCIDQIEFDVDSSSPLVVVDGHFSNLLELQKVSLTFTTNVKSQVAPPVKGAQLYFESDDQQKIPLEENDDGIYSVYAQADKNKSYRLMGVLPDGRSIESTYQRVHEVAALDSISVTDSLTIFVNESGKQSNFRSLVFDVHGSKDLVKDNLFMRVNTETSFRVSELICSPFFPPRTCYIINDVKPNKINLFEINSTNSPVFFSTTVHSRIIDYYFGEIYGVDVTLLSYERDSYLYWENLKKLFDQNGEITDVTPARLTGNIKSNDGTEVLGLFSVVGKKRLSQLITNADFKTHVNPLCGVAGIPPWPLPDACCNCSILPNSTLEKPDYW